ncbi:predicted protein [Naegleria gruberi]|uniref:Predicted protein n=1 Tax=Naegleria gruberi TaxID=5762 RepID=D2VJ70_NAEGR|nr:uncharacterized protein NAEGRDRAFT_49982 [Naegleria gruberi]EFC43227.1 predicted protein [Naegleria gruberi]|eukprot:XP_002675971.1 predicted protein [Naegleria gruberi strain NEG-M]
MHNHSNRHHDSSTTDRNLSEETTTHEEEENTSDHVNINLSSTNLSNINPRYKMSRRNSNEEEVYPSESGRKKSGHSSSTYDYAPVQFSERDSWSTRSLSNSKLVKIILRRKFWLIIGLFLLVAITFVALGLWVIMQIFRKDDSILVERIIRERINSKKILSNSEKIEMAKRKQSMVKEYAKGLNNYLLQTWSKQFQPSNSDNILDLIVFRTASGDDPINQKKLSEFISENVKTSEKIRVHIVNHEDRDVNLETVKNLMESHSNAWLIVCSEESKFSSLPSMVYPYHHLISNELFDWIDGMEFDVFENSDIQTIPSTWKERFEKSTQFWTDILVERIGKKLYQREDPPLHMADMEEIIQRNHFDALFEIEDMNEMEVLNKFKRFDILKELSECNVLSWVLPESIDESEKTKLEETFTFFLYRFRHFLKRRFNLFVTNDKTIYNRAALFMPQVLLMEEKRSTSIAANLHCLTRIQGADAFTISPLIKQKALPVMVFSREIKNEIEYVQYFEGKNPKPIKLNVAIQIEDFHAHLKGMDAIVMELAQYLRDHNARVTIINCGKLEIKSSSENIPVKRVQTKAEYKQLLQSEKFTVVNAHYSTFGLEIAKELNIPIVQTLHNQYMWLLEDKHKKLLEKFYKADHYTSMYTSVSSDVAIFSDMNLGLDINKMVVISNGISDSQLEDCPFKPLKYNERDLVWEKNILPYTVNPQILPYNSTNGYVVVSQMDDEISPAMGHHVSIIALSYAKKKIKYGAQPLLIISGQFINSKYEQYVKKLIIDNDVSDNVLFLNRNFKDECSLVKFSDVLIHPALLEGWSKQVAQGVIYDKEVVAAFNAGASEIMSNRYIENTMPTAFAKLINPPSVYHKIERKNFDLHEFLIQSHYEYEHSVSEALYAMSVGRTPKQAHSIPKDYYQELMTSFVYGGYKRLFELIQLTGSNAQYISHLFGQTYQ